MTSKEFNLLAAMLVELLKEGKTEKVIELLENAIENNSKSTSSTNDNN